MNPTIETEGKAMNKKLREIYLPSLRLYLALLFLFTVFTLLVAPWQAAAAEAAAVALAEEDFLISLTFL